MSIHNVDTDNLIVRGVSVLSEGVAEGHSLTVDAQTIREMHRSATAKGKVQFAVDHKSGAASVAGWLENFRIVGPQLLADLHLLASHEMAPKILEAAATMPSCVGLSPSFLSPEDAPAGVARCAELVAVDYVRRPAANRGLFSAQVNGVLHQFSVPAPVVTGALAGGISAMEKIRRAGIKVPSTWRPVGQAAKQFLKDNAGTFKTAGIQAAVVGTTAAAVHAIQRKQDDIEDRRAARRALFRRSFSAIGRVIDSTTANLPRPEEPRPVGIAKRVWTSDVARAARLRAAKAGALGIAGGLAAHKLLKPHGAWKVGAAVGAGAGLVFENPSMKIERHLGSLLDRDTPNALPGSRVSHTRATLAKHLRVPAKVLRQFEADGTVAAVGEVYRNGPKVYDLAAINRVRRRIAREAVIDQVIRSDGQPESLRLAGQRALHQLSTVYREEEPSTTAKVAKTAAVGAGALAGASWLRGRAGLGNPGAKAAGIAGTAKAGASMLKADIFELLRRSRAGLAAAR